MSWLLRPTMVAVVGLILASGMANADCMKNGKGEVVCGKGECQRDRRGVVLCSAFRKGSAVRTSDGKIVWEYWHGEAGDPPHAIFRANWYSSEHPAIVAMGLDGEPEQDPEE